MIDLEAARYRWHPIAASTDLVPRHVFHAQLLGREMAVWRADDGHVNAWENRCLHRGVRLSIGINDGTELVCQYHGWRYANRTAGCTYIPAHPSDAPARTICNNVYPVQEKYNLIWSGEKPEDETLPSCSLEISHSTPLRSLVVNAPLPDIALPLIDEYDNSISKKAPMGLSYGADTPDPYLLTLHPVHMDPDCDITLCTVTFFFQPLDAARTAIRGILCGIDESNTRRVTITAMLKYHDAILCRARERIEKNIHDMPTPAPWIPIFPSLSAAQSSMPEQQSNKGRQPTLRVMVSHIEKLSHNVKSFRLAPIQNTDPGTNRHAAAQLLPAPQPGAHIDVHLPNSQIRQYSLINGPGQTDHYMIAVKQIINSAGGSKVLHQSIKVGDVLASSVPRNNFSLRRDAEHTHLIAGGIGITPLLSMARALQHAELPFSVHHFIASSEDALFNDELQLMTASVNIHVGLTSQQTQETLCALLKTPNEHHHVYICGPGPMLTFARQTAKSSRWPDANIHFEYFRNDLERDNSSSFQVELSRSNLSLNVPAGTSLLEVLQQNDVAPPSSCEQGACGTCRISVLEGEPDHQDVYLNDAEKARGDCLMSCVSRAKSSRLVLDL